MIFNLAELSNWMSFNLAELSNWMTFNLAEHFTGLKRFNLAATP